MDERNGCFAVTGEILSHEHEWRPEDRLNQGTLNDIEHVIVLLVVSSPQCHKLSMPSTLYPSWMVRHEQEIWICTHVSPRAWKQ